MARPPRLHIPGAFYHVTLRGNHQQNIFHTADDRRLLDEFTAEAVTRASARLHAYCWMTNHIHMLLQVGEAPLGGLIARLAGRYAKTVQKRLSTTGHLFERRYHSVLVDADAYLLQLTRYIHFNPVRAGLVEHPSEYPWSSHRAYLGKTAPSWLTTEFVLKTLHPDRSRAIAAYGRFVKDELDRPSASPLLELNGSDGRILGSDDFAQRLLGADWRPKSNDPLAALMKEACDVFSTTTDELLSSSRERQLTKARAWIAHEALRRRIASRSEVARRLSRSEGALRQSVQVHFKARRDV